MNNLQSAGPTISSAVCIENDLTLTTYMKSVNFAWQVSLSNEN